MTFTGHWAEFVSHPLAKETVWSLDSTSGQIVVSCPRCGGESRCDQEASLFTFEHKQGCPAVTSWQQKNTRAARDDRAYDMADKISKVLEEEGDDHLALSTLAFVTTVVIDVAAEKSGKPLADWTAFFQHALDAHLNEIPQVLEAAREEGGGEIQSVH